MNPPDYESNEQTEDLRKQEEEQQSQQTASEDIQVFGITEEEVLFSEYLLLLFSFLVSYELTG